MTTLFVFFFSFHYVFRKKLVECVWGGGRGRCLSTSFWCAGFKLSGFVCFYMQISVFLSEILGGFFLSIPPSTCCSDLEFLWEIIPGS